MLKKKEKEKCPMTKEMPEEKEQKQNPSTSGYNSHEITGFQLMECRARARFQILVLILLNSVGSSSL